MALTLEQQRLDEAGLLRRVQWADSVSESVLPEAKAVEQWGTTSDPREAGYILTDGTMLDMSGKREGGSPGMRAYDHRDVNQFGTSMAAFMHRGNIRAMPETGFLHIIKFPTQQQWRALKFWFRRNAPLDVWVGWGSEGEELKDVRSAGELRTKLAGVLEEGPVDEEEVDNFLAKFGVGPKYTPVPPVKHACPKCGERGAVYKEVHPDTAMNAVVLVCKGCGHRDESVNEWSSDHGKMPTLSQKHVQRFEAWGRDAGLTVGVTAAWTGSMYLSVEDESGKYPEQFEVRVADHDPGKNSSDYNVFAGGMVEGEMLWSIAEAVNKGVKEHEMGEDTPLLRFEGQEQGKAVNHSDAWLLLPKEAEYRRKLEGPSQDESHMLDEAMTLTKTQREELIDRVPTSLEGVHLSGRKLYFDGRVNRYQFAEFLNNTYADEEAAENLGIPEPRRKSMMKLHDKLVNTEFEEPPPNIEGRKELLAERSAKLRALLREAAGKRRKVRVTYGPKLSEGHDGVKGETVERVLEPYSYRMEKSTAGPGLWRFFYGYHGNHRTIEKYLFRRIKEAEITPYKFSPRWEVELKPGQTTETHAEVQGRWEKLGVERELRPDEFGYGEKRLVTFEKTEDGKVRKIMYGDAEDQAMESRFSDVVWTTVDQLDEQGYVQEEYVGTVTPNAADPAKEFVTYYDDDITGPWHEQYENVQRGDTLSGLDERESDVRLMREAKGAWDAFMRLAAKITRDNAADYGTVIGGALSGAYVLNAGQYLPKFFRRNGAIVLGRPSWIQRNIRGDAAYGTQFVGNFSFISEGIILPYDASKFWGTGATLKEAVQQGHKNARTYFIHEYTHRLTRMRYPESGKEAVAGMRDLDMEQYYNSPDEVNAYFIQTIEAMQDELRKRYRDAAVSQKTTDPAYKVRMERLTPDVIGKDERKFVEKYRDKLSKAMGVDVWRTRYTDETRKRVIKRLYSVYPDMRAYADKVLKGEDPDPVSVNPAQMRLPYNESVRWVDGVSDLTEKVAAPIAPVPAWYDTKNRKIVPLDSRHQEHMIYLLDRLKKGNLPDDVSSEMRSAWDAWRIHGDIWRAIRQFVQETGWVRIRPNLFAAGKVLIAMHARNKRDAMEALEKHAEEEGYFADDVEEVAVTESSGRYYELSLREMSRVLESKVWWSDTLSESPRNIRVEPSRSRGQRVYRVVRDKGGRQQYWDQLNKTWTYNALGADTYHSEQEAERVADRLRMTPPLHLESKVEWAGTLVEIATDPAEVRWPRKPRDTDIDDKSRFRVGDLEYDVKFIGTPLPGRGNMAYTMMFSLTPESTEEFLHAHPNARAGPYDALGVVKSPGRVMSHVAQAVREFLTRRNPVVLNFIASKTEPKRVALYDRMVSRLLPKDWMEVPEGLLNSWAFKNRGRLIDSNRSIERYLYARKDYLRDVIQGEESRTGREEGALRHQYPDVYESEAVNGYEDNAARKAMQSSEYPATAEDGKAYCFHWADGRAITAFKHKVDALKWMDDEGGDREIVRWWYGEPVYGKDKKRIRVNSSYKVRGDKNPFDEAGQVSERRWEQVNGVRYMYNPTIQELKGLARRATGSWGLNGEVLVRGMVSNDGKHTYAWDGMEGTHMQVWAKVIQTQHKPGGYAELSEWGQFSVGVSNESFRIRSWGMRPSNWNKVAALDGMAVDEAEYDGREVDLNKPFRLPDGSDKKFGVYVKDGDKVKKVTFGSSSMEIKRDDPERRKNFRARHNCADKKDKTSAGYWSCKMWQKGTSVSDMLDKG